MVPLYMIPVVPSMTPQQLAINWHLHMINIDFANHFGKYQS